MVATIRILELTQAAQDLKQEQYMKELDRIANQEALEAAKQASHGVEVAGDLTLRSEPYKYFENVRKRTDIDPNGYFDIVVHGSDKTVQIQINGKMIEVDHRFIGNMLSNSNQYSGQPIRLLSCNTGSMDVGFAQNLANYMNVEVIAPTKFIWAYPNGVHIIAGGEWINGKLVMVSSDPGIMQSFIPGGNVH